MSASVSYDRFAKRFNITVDGKHLRIDVQPGWRGLDPQWVLMGVASQCNDQGGVWLPADAREEILRIVQAGLYHDVNQLYERRNYAKL